MDQDTVGNLIIIGIFIFLVIVTIYCYGLHKDYKFPYFCKEDQETEHQHPEYYNSDEGMLTKVWGPPLWLFLHTISFNYKVNPSEEDKKNYKNFIYSLQHVLPCRYCRENFTKNLVNFPLTDEALANRESFSRWVYQIHNIINNNTNKKTYQTYEEVRDYYEQFRARCGKTQQKLIEKGCTVPKYVKQKCILKIEPE